MPHLDISACAKEHGWIESHDAGRQTDIIDEAAVLSYLSGYDDVIIDAHYAELFNCDYIFVVRCPPKQLVSRLLARSYGPEKIRENVLSEMLDTCLVRAIEAVGRSRTYEVLQDVPDAMTKAVASLIRCPDSKKSVKHVQTARYLTGENLDYLQRF
jgi:broad-specificity NMP kinase